MTLGTLGNATSDRPAFTPRLVESFQYQGHGIEILECPDRRHARYSVFVTDPDGQRGKTEVNYATLVGACEDGRRVVDRKLEAFSG
jgi:hypothetical protein